MRLNSLLSVKDRTLNNFKNLPEGKKIVLLVFSGLLGFILTANVYSLLYRLDIDKYLGLWFYFLFFTLLSLSTAATSLLSYKIELNTDKDIKNNSYKNVLYYALPCIAVWGFILLVYYPGLTSVDSYVQWAQVKTFKFGDHHPVFSTLYLWLTSGLGNNIFYTSVFQILSLSFSFGLIMNKFEQLNVPKKGLIILTLLFALNPANCLLSITMWKQIPYSICILLVTFFLFQVITDKNWLESNKNSAFFILILSSMMLFTYNAALPFWSTIIGLFIFYRDKWKRIAVIALISVFLVVFIKSSLEKTLNVAKTSDVFMYFNNLHYLSAVLKSDKSLNTEEKMFLNKIYPLETLKNSYDPFTVNWNFLTTDVNYKEIKANKAKFYKIYLKAIVNNPAEFISAWTKISSITWSVIRFESAYTFTSPNGKNIFKPSTVKFIYEEIFGFQPLTPYFEQTKIKSLLPMFIDKFNVIFDASKDSLINCFIWRPAFYLLIILSCSLLFVLKNKMNGLILLFPSMSSVLGMLICTPAQDFRYLYFLTLLTPFFILAAFTNVCKPEKAEMEM